MRLDIDNRNLEIHTVLCGRDVPYLLWSLYSLFAHLPFRCPVHVHSDGTIDSRQRALISESFPGINIIEIEESTKMVDPLLVGYPSLHRFRHESFYGLKLLDVCLSAKSPVLLLDSDILFFSPPTEIVGSLPFVSDGGFVFNCEFDNPRYWKLPILQGKFPEVIGGLNSGLLLFNPGVVCKLPELEEIVSWMRECRESLPRVDEQTVYAILAGRYPSRALSSLYCTISKPSLPEKDLVSRHYHSDLRPGFALDGIKHLCL
jgi:hypothetical protein